MLRHFDYYLRLLAWGVVSQRVEKQIMGGLKQINQINHVLQMGVKLLSCWIRDVFWLGPPAPKVLRSDKK